MQASHRFFKWFTRSLCCGLTLVSSCQSVHPGAGRDTGNGVDCVEGERSESFLEICRKLESSDGFSQNVWLCGKLDASVAICMDLDRRLYLVVRSERPARAANQIDETYKQLMVSPEILRSRMHPDSFILNGGAEGQKLVEIFRIPENAEESFAINLINHVLNLDLSLNDQSFQWD